MHTHTHPTHLKAERLIYSQTLARFTRITIFTILMLLIFAPSTQQRRWILSVERAMCSCGRTFFYRLSSHQSVPVLLLCAPSYGDRKWKFVVVATAHRRERGAKKSCKLFLYFSWFFFLLSDFLFHIFSVFVVVVWYSEEQDEMTRHDRLLDLMWHSPSPSAFLNLIRFSFAARPPSLLSDCRRLLSNS